MSKSVMAEASPRHRDLLQALTPKPAKAVLKNLQGEQEDRDDKAAWGAVLAMVPSLMQLSDKEFAGVLGVSPQQLANWHAGTENAALWRYYRDPDVNDALLLAQGRANKRVDVVAQMVVRLK